MLLNAPNPADRWLPGSLPAPLQYSMHAGHRTRTASERAWGSGALKKPTTTENRGTSSRHRGERPDWSRSTGVPGRCRAAQRNTQSRERACIVMAKIQPVGNSGSHGSTAVGAFSFQQARAPVDRRCCRGFKFKGEAAGRRCCTSPA